MRAADLVGVEKELSSTGFAVRSGTLSEVRFASLMANRWALVPQKGGEASSSLRPMEQDQAPARTISATHGLGAQPLHSDGAHLRKPPDVIVLFAADPTTTATVIWKLRPNYPSSLSSGVFTVRARDNSFLTHALDTGRLRFDPGCMYPSDHLAREAQAYLTDAREHAHYHQWKDGGTLLFIDNKRALHAREAVTDADDAESRLLERASYSLGQS